MDALTAPQSDWGRRQTLRPNRGLLSASSGEGGVMMCGNTAEPTAETRTVPMNSGGEATVVGARGGKATQWPVNVWELIMGVTGDTAAFGSNAPL